MADKELHTLSDTPIGGIERINDLRKEYKDNVYYFYFVEEKGYELVDDKTDKWALIYINDMKILHKFVGFDDQEYQNYKKKKK